MIARRCEQSNSLCLLVDGFWRQREQTLFEEISRSKELSSDRAHRHALERPPSLSQPFAYVCHHQKEMEEDLPDRFLFFFPASLQRLFPRKRMTHLDSLRFSLIFQAENA